MTYSEAVFSYSFSWLIDLLMAFFWLTVWLASTVAGFPSRNKPRSTQTLRFTAEGTFQISIFEDLHYGEGLRVLSQNDRSFLTNSSFIRRRYYMGTPARSWVGSRHQRCPRLRVTTASCFEWRFDNWRKHILGKFHILCWWNREASCPTKSELGFDLWKPRFRLQSLKRIDICQREDLWE